MGNSWSMRGGGEGRMEGREEQIRFIDARIEKKKKEKERKEETLLKSEWKGKRLREGDSRCRAGQGRRVRGVRGVRGVRQH